MRIYLDHSATAPLAGGVAEAMAPYLGDRFGNPSSAHQWGREARRAVEQSRIRVAESLGTQDKEEVVFVSGGTEADVLALWGLAFARRERGRRILTSSVEHPAVLEACAALEGHGFVVERIAVDGQGCLEPEAVLRALRPETILVSLMHANNETGVRFPIETIGPALRERGVPFHTDAVQSFGKDPIRVHEWGIDLLSLSGHKIGGPKGVGALYVRRGVRLAPLIVGGHQERSRRAGTENIPAIVGLAAAIAAAPGPEVWARVRSLRDRLEAGLLTAVPEAVVNGHPRNRLPHVTNIAFPQVAGEALLVALDMEGVAVSMGSACSSGSVQPSHVLAAMGCPLRRIQGSLRFSLGRDTTVEEIDRVIALVPELIQRLVRTKGVAA